MPLGVPRATRHGTCCLSSLLFSRRVSSGADSMRAIKASLQTLISAFVPTPRTAAHACLRNRTTHSSSEMPPLPSHQASQRFARTKARERALENSVETSSDFIHVTLSEPSTSNW